jgi:PAS domain S-box-containing protein
LGNSKEISEKLEYLRLLIRKIPNSKQSDTFVSKCESAINELEHSIQEYVSGMPGEEILGSEYKGEYLSGKWDALIDNIQSGFYIYHLEDLNDDSTLRMVYANPEAEKMTGVKNSHLTGKTIDECFPGLRERNIPYFYAEVVRKQIPYVLSDFFFDKDDVNPKNYNIKAFPLQGNQVGVFFNDVTPLKNALKAFEESELKYRLLAENSGDIVFSLDKKFRFTYVSPVAEKMLGFQISEFTGKYIWDFMSDKSKSRVIKRLKKRQKEWDKRLNINISSKSEYELIRKDTKNIWVEVYASPILNKRQIITGYSGSARDITGQKKYENELKIAKEKAEESDKLKSAFLANMSHEIRTPMNGILGFASMLNREDLPQDRKEKYLGFINSSTRQLLTIINDIIDISRIEAGQLKILYTEVSLPELMEEVFVNIEAERNIRRKYDVEIKVSFPPERDVKIKSDEIRLKQVLINLLNNSLKFTDEGYIEMGYSFEEKDKVIFFVKDTGIGISPEYRTKIFDRFTQAEEIMDMRYGGTGLGLAISKGIIELLGGNVWFNSEKGKGTVFYFSIPYKTIPEKKSNKHNDNTFKYNDWSDKKILVVEDDIPSIEYIKAALKPTGLKIDLANTGEEAVKLFRKNKNYNLVLMDLKLPVMDGYEAIRQIKSINRRIPVIVQSAYVMADQKEKAFNCGCNDFVSKPIDRLSFLTAISTHIL